MEKRVYDWSPEPKVAGSNPVRRTISFNSLDRLLNEAGFACGEICGDMASIDLHVGGQFCNFPSVVCL